MHFLGARVAHHANDLLAGGAAHDGIVDQHHALARQHMAHRIQLQLHAEVAHPLLRLDEGAANVVVADQSELQRNAALMREAHGRGHAGVGHGNHDVGLDRRFERKLPAHGVARLLHRASEDHAVGPRKIHVLEDAARLRLLRRVEARMHSFRADDDQLARLDLALIGCADQVEGAGLGGEDDGVGAMRRLSRKCGPSPAAGSRADRARRRPGRG